MVRCCKKVEEEEEQVNSLLEQQLKTDRELRQLNKLIQSSGLSTEHVSENAANATQLTTEAGESDFSLRETQLKESKEKLLNQGAKRDPYDIMGIGLQQMRRT